MTLHRLQILAALHKVPLPTKSKQAHSPVAFLSQCNLLLVSWPRQLRRWRKATQQPTYPGRIPYRRKRFHVYDSAKFTTTGKKRKGKTIITPVRQQIKNLYWIPIRQALRAYLYHPKSHRLISGRQIEVARAIGTSASQIHRWSCPICEHDQETNFSLGFQLLLFLRSKEMI